MNFIEWLKVILLGIVEGITEWLPISSTGHLILTDAIWPLQQSDAFKEMFNVVIQLGAILAVVVLYWSKLWPFHRKRIPQRSWFAQQSTNGFVGGLQRFGDRYCCMDKIVMWLKIAVSCLPAMLIGVFQVLALIPGTSRSGATILGGILIGASREVAAEYTFFLAVPVMFGASLLKIVKFGAISGTELGVLLVGMAVAFGVSILAIRFLMGYIRKHDFTAFGWYRIGLGLLVLLYFYVIR